MRKALPVVVVVVSIITTGCTMFHKRAATPDEFAVARNAPLIIPPDFSLAPPVAGTSGLSPTDAQQQAIDTLFGSPAPRSPSETSLLESAGRNSAQSDIRSTVWDPDTRMVDKGATTLTILQAPAADSNIATAQAGQ